MDNQDAHLAKFLEELKSIPWFSNIGRPVPSSEAVKQYQRWEDWPGPDDTAIFELTERQQILYDELLEATGKGRDALSNLWERIHELVIRLASPSVPFDAERDAWHAPTTAVWQAAWTAGLVAFCIVLDRPIPKELQEQWNWFKRGHWPAGYSVVWADDRLGPLVVF